MTTADRVGLFLLGVSFGTILSPVALSESDPYHAKNVLEEITSAVHAFGYWITLQYDEPLNPNTPSDYEIIDGKPYRVIAHLKVQPSKTYPDNYHYMIIPDKPDGEIRQAPAFAAPF